MEEFVVSMAEGGFDGSVIALAAVGAGVVGTILGDVLFSKGSPTVKAIRVSEGLKPTALQGFGFLLGLAFALVAVATGAGISDTNTWEAKQGNLSAAVEHFEESYGLTDMALVPQGGFRAATVGEKELSTDRDLFCVQGAEAVDRDVTWLEDGVFQRGGVIKFSGEADGECSYRLVVKA